MIKKSLWEKSYQLERKNYIYKLYLRYYGKIYTVYDSFRENIRRNIK